MNHLHLPGGMSHWGLYRRVNHFLKCTLNEDVVLMDNFRRVPLSLTDAKGPDKLRTTKQREQGKYVNTL